jgi:predicted Zn finger-like uncharacterized protein
MIISCPSCATRLDHNRLDIDGGVVRCPSCGHGWLEAKPIETMRTMLQTIEPVAAPDLAVEQLVSASLQAKESFALRRKRKRLTFAAWLGLAMFAISPAAIAVAIPDKVVSIAPATISFYNWIGREVNIYGLEIRRVELQHLLVGGQKVIAIKGEFVNVSQSDRKIPWLRFGLTSADRQELYEWQLDTESRPLRPGEAKSFVTRVAAPPENASLVEIRFARADEIGSNTKP